jgi:glycosyltransferase involved in cell wall biosynthesis
MKLLIYCYEYPPLGAGAGNALYHLCREWKKAGHEITIVTSALKGETPFMESKEGIQIRRLDVGRKSRFKGRVSEMITFMRRCSTSFKSFYESIQPDLCVSFLLIPGGGLAPLRMKNQFGVPYIVELRGGDTPGFGLSSLKLYHLVARPVMRLLLKNCAQAIAVGEGLRLLVKDSVKTVEVIGNGVDVDKFTPSNQEKTGGIKILFVGRLVDSQKKISKLMHAVRNTPGTHLTVAGDGEDRATLENLAKKMQIGNRISFTGWLDKENLLKQYQSADIYASASIAEGMSNSALEALSCGLALLLTNIYGHTELVDNGGNGWVFDPESQADLEAKLTEMTRDRDFLRQMGRKSREKAVRQFTWAGVAAQRMAIYEKVARRG